MRTGVLAVLLAAAGALACATGKNLGEGVGKGAVRGISEQRAAAGKGPVDPYELASKMSAGGLHGLLAEPLTPAERANLHLLVESTVQPAMQGLVSGEAGAGAPGTGLSAGMLTPPGMAPMEELGAQLARGFARELTSQLAQQLGPDGKGPLGQGMAGAARNVASASIDGVREELPMLFPECRGTDRAACLQERLRQLSAATTAGAVQGFTAHLDLPLAALAFVAGLLAAALLFLLALSFGTWRRMPPPPLRERRA
jgi:hypothetical protein